jgi:hypothetical protein
MRKYKLNIITVPAALAAFAALAALGVSGCPKEAAPEPERIMEGPTGVLTLLGVSEQETYSAAVYRNPADSPFDSYAEYEEATRDDRLLARSDAASPARGETSLRLPLRRPAGNTFRDSADALMVRVGIRGAGGGRREAIFYRTDTAFADGNAEVDLDDSETLNGTDDLFVVCGSFGGTGGTGGTDGTDGGSALGEMLDKKSTHGLYPGYPLYIVLDGGEEKLYAMADALKAGENSPQFVTIDGGGRTLRLLGRGAVLRVGTGLTLTLRNITLAGVPNNNSALVVVEGGSLVLGAGAKITGNTDASQAAFSRGGGGVRMDAGTLVFPDGGGAVLANAAVVGGGVYLGAGTTLEMRGGRISNNSASVNGGGVYRTKGAVITGNPKVGDSGLGPGVIDGNSGGDLFEAQ